MTEELDLPEPIMTECSRCGEKKECDFIVDPLVDEVFSDDPDFNHKPRWWCRDCAEWRRDEI